MPKFFAFDDETGFDIYDTAAEAKQAAQQSINEWRDACDPNWPEQVQNVCWGEIIEESTEEETGQVQSEAQGGQDIVDYNLTKIK